MSIFGLAAAVLAVLELVSRPSSATVEAIDDDGDRVGVAFRSGTRQEFDRIVGAEGLHSQVRTLAFAPSDRA